MCHDCGIGVAIRKDLSGIFINFVSDDGGFFSVSIQLLLS